MPLFKNAASFNMLVFVCFCIVNGNVFSFFPDIGEDECDIGTCVEVKDCPTALHAVHHTRGIHNLERCGWNKFSEKVCCLDLIPPTSTDVSSSTEDELISSTTTPIPTTQPSAVTSSTQSNVPRGNVRKSEEACQRYGVSTPFQINYHILNGEVASEGEFPHMAALGYVSDDGGTDLRWICGGSVISDKHILTAAHCVTSRRRPVRILLGTLNVTDQSAFRREYNIGNITLHPGYRRELNDIALVTTSETIVFNSNVYPACLYQRNNDPLGLIITGWGRTEVEREVFSDVLLKARVIPVSLETCNETFIRINRPLVQTHICAGSASMDPNAATDSCPGDSGGPLQVLAQDNLMYEIVGIVSFGLTVCGSAPSVYTRVYQYLDWIEPIVWP